MLVVVHFVCILDVQQANWAKLAPFHQGSLLLIIVLFNNRFGLEQINKNLRQLGLDDFFGLNTPVLDLHIEEPLCLIVHIFWLVFPIVSKIIQHHIKDFGVAVQEDVVVHRF